MALSDEQEIANLLYRYAELVDAGELGGMASLFADAEYQAGDGPPLRDAAAVERLNRGLVILYGDGTPRTQHVTSNLLLELAEDGASATGRSRFTVFQEFPVEAGGGIHPIAMGRYHDRFARVDGRWRFAARRIFIDRVGDLSHHLRLDALVDGATRA